MSSISRIAALLLCLWGALACGEQDPSTPSPPADSTQTDLAFDAEPYDGAHDLAFEGDLATEPDAGPLDAQPEDADPCPPVGLLEALEATPLDVIELDGSHLADAADEYQWVVTRRAEGSTSQPVERFIDNASPADGGQHDDPTTPTAKFFVDLAGDYEITLRIVRSWCPQPVVVRTQRLIARTNPNLIIRATWTVEPERSRAGFDLHLLHPLGVEWGADRYDFRPGQDTPDWGAPGWMGDPYGREDPSNGEIQLFPVEDTAPLGAPYRIALEPRLFDAGDVATVELEISWRGVPIWNREVTRTAEDGRWEAVEVHIDGLEAQAVDGD